MTSRPISLKDVALLSGSIKDFGRNLRDWLHSVRGMSSRPEASRAITEAPPRLHRKFPRGRVADAWLAAYAEHLASTAGVAPPAWAFERARTAVRAVFDVGSSRRLRALALAHAPPAFRRRNLFTPSVDLPLSLRRGQPAKSLEERRKTNAARQRRFREARQAELQRLRALASAYRG